MVMLGAFIYKTKLISMKTLKKILTRDVAKRNPRLLEMNEKALMEGFTYLERRREGNAG
jgi:Pyruvate/2-oxoacid:ferredoxin oxidoreductase gamma subunit